MIKRKIPGADETLGRVANIEAGTDIAISGDALSNEALVNSGFTLEGVRINGTGIENGVTDNAPYKHMAEYTMIPKDEENLQNNQGS